MALTREPEMLARKFHEIYERLAPQFGYETRKETRQFDPTTPNGKLMIAVCAELFRHWLATEQMVVTDAMLARAILAYSGAGKESSWPDHERMRAALESFVAEFGITE